jgi:hypothetical protein
MTDSSMLEIQRALGRLESAQEGTRQEFRNGLRAIKEDFSAHKNDDQRNFSSLRSALKDQRDEREGHLNQQDMKLGELATVSTRLEEQDKNTKAIGKWIIAAFGSLTLFIGTAVVAALTGHIKII